MKKIYSPCDTLGTGLGAVHAAGRAVSDAAQAVTLATESIRHLLRRAAPLPTADRRFLDGVPGLLKDRGYRASTVRTYSTCVARYVIWRHRQGLVKDGHDVAGFLADLAARRYRSGVLRLHLGALRTVFDRLLGETITQDLSYAPRPPCTAAAPPQDIRRLVADAPQREALLVLLAATAGLRPSELSGLRWQHVSTSQRTVHVVRGRRARTVELPIPADVAARLARYRTAGAKPEDLVFTGQKPGCPLAVRSIQSALKRLCESHGIVVTYTRLTATARLLTVSLDGAPRPDRPAGGQARPAVTPAGRLPAARAPPTARIRRHA